MRRCFLPFLCLLCALSLGSLPVAAAPLIAVEVQDGPAGVELPVTIRTAENTPPLRLGDVKFVDGEVHIDVWLSSASTVVFTYPAVLVGRLPKLPEGTWPVKVFTRSGQARELAATNSVEIGAVNIRFTLVGGATESDDLLVRLNHRPSTPLRVEKGLGRVRISSQEATVFTPSPEGYDVSLGLLPAGEWRIELVHDTALQDQQLVEVAPDPIVLAGNFELRVQWRTAAGAAGRGKLALPPAADSALLYFFSPANWELMVKVLDGCAINGHYWVFAAASTDVGFTIDIHRRNSEQSFRRENPIGVAAPAITNIEAFPCGEAVSALR